MLICTQSKGFNAYSLDHVELCSVINLLLSSTSSVSWTNQIEILIGLFVPQSPQHLHTYLYSCITNILFTSLLSVIIRYICAHQSYSWATMKNSHRRSCMPSLCSQGMKSTLCSSNSLPSFKSGSKLTTYPWLSRIWNTNYIFTWTQTIHTCDSHFRGLHGLQI